MSDTTNPSVTRRSLAKGAACGAAALASGAGALAALAEEAPAGGDAVLEPGRYSFEIYPGDIAEEDIARTVETDVVVIGAGISGLCATAAAAEEGADVVCLEKYSLSAGSGMYFGFVNSEKMLAIGARQYDVDAFLKELAVFAQYANDLELTGAVVRQSAGVCDWLMGIAEQSGTEANYEPGQDCVYFGQNGQETAVYEMLTAYAQGLGASFEYDTEVVRIERDADGRATGVVALSAEGGYARYAASKGIVLCTGHYGGNDEMLAKYIPWAVGDMLQKCPTASVTNTGDGLKMALWAGARIGAAPHCAMIHFIDGATPLTGILYVNAFGRRFCPSGMSMEFIAQQFMRQPGNVVYQVWDSTYERPASVYQFGDDVEVYEADTLDELAAKIGVDAEGLVATAARWNELVESGVDSDCFDDLSEARTVLTGPFHAEICPVGKMAMMGGPLIDAQMRVVDGDYRPIEGFYAAGTCTSGFWGLNYPTEVKNGICRSFCATSGYLAGKNACA